MKKILSILIILGLAVFLSAGSAMALQQLDFGIVAPTAGTISYGGGSAALVGSGIDVDNVTGLGTPLNDLVSLGLSNAFLNFSTGASTGTWTWGGGPMSTISIVGGVPALGIADGSTLLSGSFGTASVVNLSGVFYISGASFSDVKDATLLSYYGLPTTTPTGAPYPYMGNFNISFNTGVVVPAGSAFTSSTVLSGDVTNAVPEPATMLLLGSGLIGLAGIGRKKFRK